MPNPPCRASAIAIADSVTVSIGELIRGRLIVILRLTFDSRFTSEGLKSI